MECKEATTRNYNLQDRIRLSLNGDTDLHLTRRYLGVAPKIAIRPLHDISGDVATK